MANFLTTLCEMRGGLSVEELDAKLTELVTAVRTTGKTGKLALTVIVRPASKGHREGTALLLEDQIKSTVPSLDRESTIFFASAENELSRRDPRQMEFTELKEPENNKPAPAQLKVVG